jgi:hypothetical protein
MLAKRLFYTIVQLVQRLHQRVNAPRALIERSQALALLGLQRGLQLTLLTAQHGCVVTRRVDAAC